MDAQFHKLKLQDHYQRFPAIDGRTLQRSSSQLRPEEIGCFMSHLLALRTLTYKPGGYILEDDTLLSHWIVPVMTNLIGKGVFE
jgi:GR25 family glycosyltransferase involved in LPS biosynthesis